MTPNPHPSNALFIGWGKFQAGAFGIPAIITLALLTAVLAMWLLR
jgi:hypothetical protein